MSCLDRLLGVYYLRQFRSIHDTREILELDRTADIQVAVHNLMISKSSNVARSPAWCFSLRTVCSLQGFRDIPE